MPQRNINKIDFVNLIRELFVTKEDASYLYEKIYEMVLTSLLDGTDVNLFGCVKLKRINSDSRIIKNAFGKKDILLPSRYNISCSVYPKLKNDWKILNE